ncbi:MAG: hypothetical protein WA110_03690 [Anaerolineaceae bacterium]
MTLKDPDQLSRLVKQVRNSPKYAQISESLVERIAREELDKHPNFEDSVKSTRTRLHQVVGAYLAPRLNYALWTDIFSTIPVEEEQERKSHCQAMMRLHNSTSERLPFLETFYHTCLASIAPVSSVLDLACGLNPLALAWMPLAPDCTYYACDVVLPMLTFLNHFFATQHVHGQAFDCDLTSTIPSQRVQVAFLLKTLPCLDQLDKSLGARLLEEVKADHILISYPSKSLGGKSKGMLATYTEQFARLIAGASFSVKSFTFPNEIAFLLSRPD